MLGALNWAAEWWNPRRGSLATVVRTAQSIVRHGFSADVSADTTLDPPVRRPKARKATTAKG